jgi:hypothetical protein
MTDEMRNETIELCVTACEKHSSNNEVNEAVLLLSNIIKKIIEPFRVPECSKTNQRVYGHQIRTLVARSRWRGIRPRDYARMPQPSLHVFRR